MIDIGKEEIVKLRKVREIKLNEMKAELLGLFAEHFKKNASNTWQRSSDFQMREINCGVEQGSYINIEISHYGIENYYGKEIADLYKRIKEELDE